MNRQMSNSSMPISLRTKFKPLPRKELMQQLQNSRATRTVAVIRHPNGLAVVLIYVILMAAAGCSEQGPLVPESTASIEQVETIASGEQHFWDAIFVGGTHVGHNHIVIRETAKPVTNEKQLAIQMKTVITVKRFGTETKQAMEIASKESVDGKIDRIVTTMISGSGKVQSEISNNGDELVVTSDTAGVKSQSKLPSNCLGILGYEPDLQRRPMRPGESRQYRLFVPFMNSIADTSLEAKAIEETSLLEGRDKLLRIDCIMTMAGGNRIGVTIWSNEKGDVLKTDMSGLQTTFRTTQDKAVPGDSAGELDLGTESMVRVDRPIKMPHSTMSVRYRVTLKKGDAQELLAQTELQLLKPVDNRTVELTVNRGRPNSSNRSEDRFAKPNAEFLEANALIQSDDAIIKDMASGIPSGSSDWETACKLEQFVNELITQKNFSTAFASAKEVAESKQGDCTEHAVLLVALCRAKQIPARGAIGLVYVQSEQACAFHMWSEAWIDGRWLPLDATLGIGGTGAAHIKVSDTSLANGTGMESMLPVLQLIGDVQIEVLEVSHVAQ